MEDTIPSTPSGTDCGSGGQARYAARMFPDRHGADGIERSICATPGRTRRLEDHLRSAIRSEARRPLSRAISRCWNFLRSGSLLPHAKFIGLHMTRLMPRWRRRPPRFPLTAAILRSGSTLCIRSGQPRLRAHRGGYQAHKEHSQAGQLQRLGTALPESSFSAGPERTFTSGITRLCRRQASTFRRASTCDSWRRSRVHAMHRQFFDKVMVNVDESGTPT